MRKLFEANESLGRYLKSRNFGVFKNDDGEYCRILRYYLVGKQKYQVKFYKEIGDTETRPDIITSSESKVVKLIKDENFVLQPDLK